jgi:hypothetical protein
MLRGLNANSGADTGPQIDQRAILEETQRLTPEAFRALLREYNIDPGPDDLIRRNPTQNLPSAALPRAVQLKAAEDRLKQEAHYKKLQETKFDGRNASAEAVSARAKEYGINTSAPGLLPVQRSPSEGRPLSPDWHGEPVFDRERFRKVQEANLDSSIRENLALSERQAADARRVNQIREKVTPKPEPAGTHAGNWPAIR